MTMRTMSVDEVMSGRALDTDDTIAYHVVAEIYGGRGQGECYATASVGSHVVYTAEEPTVDGAIAAIRAWADTERGQASLRTAWAREWERIEAQIGCRIGNAE